MRTSFFLLFIVTMAFSCGNPHKDTHNAPSDYQIVPRPNKIEIKTGRFLVDESTKISTTSNLESEGKYLANLLGSAGFKVPVVTNGGNIVLKTDAAITNSEGYILDIAYDKITISGGSAKGVFYGIQTLRQLLPSELDKAGATLAQVTIPAAHVEDAPRFGYRGMMLDVARHYFPVSFVKQYIDLIAMHKMNTMHWHLTEDQGWRIEIKKYPKLTEVGAYRNGTIIGRHPGTGNNQKRYGGYYTQEEVKEIVAYAAERHITVIPEIEMPGHSGAAIAAYPYLSCFPEEPTKVYGDMISEASKKLQAQGQPKIVQETWGVMDDVYNAGKETTFEFLEDVLDEVIPLFPAKYIHIGGDECPKGNWERSPECQAKMKELGLKDEHELQSYFIQRMEKYINSKGKSIIGWDEILEGGLAPNATVMSWRGIKGGIEAAKQGHDVIMTPTTHCYFDYHQVEGEDQEKEPLAIGGYLPVEKVYSYEPLPEELNSQEQELILGVQANLWTEYIPTSKKAEYFVLPRMTALSEVAWSKKEDKDWEDFKGRLQHISKRFDAMDLNYAKHSIE